MNTMKKTVMLTVAAAGLAFASVARATESPAAAAAKADIQKTLGFVPQFFTRFPEAALPGAWEEMKTLQLNPGTALNGRTKELVGLGVAAQIPCRYCIIADTEFAKLEGATDREIGEAIAMSGLVRHWSTIMNGRQADKVAFKKDINRLVAGAKKHMAAAPMPAGKPAAMTAAK